MTERESQYPFEKKYGLVFEKFKFSNQIILLWDAKVNEGPPIRKASIPIRKNWQVMTTCQFC